MKKKLSLLIVFICLFSIGTIKVNAAGVCGYAYVSQWGGYQAFYEQGSNGYCGPSKKYIENSRGYSTSGNPYTVFAWASCNSKHCKYVYEVEKKKNVTATSSRDVHNFPSGYMGSNEIALYYDYPQRKNSFFGYQSASITGLCLQREKGEQKPFQPDIDAKYLVAGNGRGYLGVWCNLDSDQTDKTEDDYVGNNCSSTYMYSGCNNGYVETLKTKLQLVGTKEGIAECQNLTISTSYDSTTVSCVKAYQTFKGLSSDGISGSKTLSALNDDYKTLTEEAAKTAAKDKAINYYNVIYDTNGGYFANGETKRTVIYHTNEVVISPSIPGKKGYKFLGWYNGNETYTFNKVLSGNITLTAKWQQYSTSLYCENDNDVLDVDAKECITVQRFEKDNSNITEDKFYIVTPNILQTIRTTYTQNRQCINNLYNVISNVKIEGSNNSIKCGTDLPYIRDSWRAEDTCTTNSYCEDDQTTECKITWRGTCYASYKAADSDKEASEYIDYLNNDNDNQTPKDNGTENISENPETGSKLWIFITLGITFSVAGTYYYRKYRKTEV